jgi:hypothetical protein
LQPARAALLVLLPPARPAGVICKIEAFKIMLSYNYSVLVRSTCPGFAKEKFIMAAKSSNLSLFLQVALLLIVAAFLYRLMAPRGPVGGDGKLPEFQVAGWFNGPPPDLEKKIVVLDALASW